MDQKPIQVTKKHIESLSPVAIAHDPAVRNQVVSKMQLMYKMPEAEAIRYYEREKDYFSKIVSQSDELRKCTPMSLYFAFMKAGALRLSFDNGKDAQIYLLPGNRNVGTKESPVWIKEVVAQPSPYGEKEVRINSGILKKVGEPYIVHEGDVYKVFMNESGNKTVIWEEAAKKSNKIIGSFIRLVEPDGEVKFVTFDIIDINRWKASSEKKNKNKGANELYASGPGNQIDEGFLKAKTLLHAFKGYKRVDFAYSAPAGFVPDDSVVTQLSAGYMDDLVEEAEYAEDQQPDEFTKELNQPEPEKESVKVETTKEEDDLF